MRICPECRQINPPLGHSTECPDLYPDKEEQGTNMNEYTINVSDRGERHLGSVAEEFDVSKDDIVISKLKMRGVSKEIAAELYLNDKIGEAKARNYFDEEEIESLNKNKNELENIEQKDGDSCE